MFCMKCQTDLASCTCPDLKERLESIAHSPYIASKWCSKCDNHHAMCKCKEPIWYVRTGEAIYANVDGLCEHPECDPSESIRLAFICEACSTVCNLYTNIVPGLPHKCPIYPNMNAQWVEEDK